MVLKDLVAAVNAWPNRPSQREMLKIASCRYCNGEFPVQSQDHALWTSKGVGFVCGHPSCRERQANAHNASRRRRRS